MSFFMHTRHFCEHRFPAVSFGFLWVPFHIRIRIDRPDRTYIRAEAQSVTQGDFENDKRALESISSAMR